MKTKLWLFVAGLLVIANVSTADLTPDLYWISYTGLNQKDAPCCLPAGPKYLMQIDALGNIVIPPQKVLTVKQVASNQTAPTTIGHRDSTTLNLWTTNRKREVIRATISKRVLTVLNIKNTKLKIGNDQHLQVTQKSTDNFIVGDLETPEGAMPAALAISSAGAFTGETSAITRTPSTFNCFSGFRCGSGISSDGRMAVLGYDTDKTRLQLQPLTITGKPKGSPQNIFVSRLAVVSFDITGVLAGEKRFLIYVQRNSPTQETLFLQNVNARTGIKIGERIRLSGIASATGQSIAIDPLGQFVIYRADTGPFPSFDLIFQALDATGRASGLPRTIAKDIESGVDLLKD